MMRVMLLRIIFGIVDSIGAAFPDMLLAFYDWVRSKFRHKAR